MNCVKGLYGVGGDDVMKFRCVGNLYSGDGDLGVGLGREPGLTVTLRFQVFYKLLIATRIGF